MLTFVPFVKKYEFILVHKTNSPARKSTYILAFKGRRLTEKKWLILNGNLYFLKLCENTHTQTIRSEIIGDVF